MQEVKELIDLIHSELKPLGYKKKDRKWSIETEELVKGVDIQRSNFSKLYYINYGFIIKGLDLGDWYHHYSYRLSSITSEENQFVKTFLDFENQENTDVVRFTEILRKNMIAELNSINTIMDLRGHILEDQRRSVMLTQATKKFLDIEI
ncbi:hypothetical protein DSL64_05805 [Dyadobacter luteus]|jgi:hypothetical protein|uniref:DUF4304 domain-containing protein n=1 Tax=Dyadobacter luteus TaxID=2259619 RepID=A0A3D8YFP1_9BACT|nr:DUF4304 domain-containing protein [Dyadobacter luteus]REA63130.1 hypothetical protein DSL64_05805 [Dyadobacter luteus]